MNPARHKEERTDHDHEGHVVDSGTQDARRLIDDEQMIKANHAGQDEAKLVVMTVPMVLRDQGTERDGEQQDSEGQHDQPIRFRDSRTQGPNHFQLDLSARKQSIEDRSRNLHRVHPRTRLLTTNPGQGPRGYFVSRMTWPASSKIAQSSPSLKKNAFIRGLPSAFMSCTG